MNRRPLHFVSRELEWELIQRLLTIVDNSKFDSETAVVMAGPDYSGTVGMHLAHAWSVNGETLPIIPIDVTYPDETADYYIKKMESKIEEFLKYKHLVITESCVIRGGNWKWIIELLNKYGYDRSNITLVTLVENIHSKVKSDYVGKYYDDDKEENMFYYERFNKHWEIR